MKAAHSNANRPVNAGGILQLDFAVTILISAFLLFQVQPLICKVILPWFGGSPAVWTTCMLFFQVVLFCGYAYAHLASRFLSPRWQAALHLGLLVLATITLPIAPDQGWKPTGGTSPVPRILLLLAANVGLPYFVLSSTGPLLQAWFAHVFPGRSPYRLYALSNLGSLLALFSYPFVFERAFDVLTHAWIWSGGFALFVLPCGAAAIWLRRRARDVRVGADPPDASLPTRPSLARRALWLGLPACATLMLLATTNHVCQEVAVIPFLWVVPLGLYLISFIITFDHERWYARKAFGLSTVVLVLAVAGIRPLSDWLGALGHDFGFSEQVLLYFLALFSICMLCHGELVRLRPSPRYLTEFYLMVSAGGALGGVLVSLVSPAVFSTYFEWEVGLVVSFLLGAIVLEGELLRRFRPLRGLARLAPVVPIAAGVGCVGVFRAGGDPPLDVSRNFYGVVAVDDADEDDPEGHYRAMIHGGTVHGRQFLAAEKRRQPIAYYGPDSGIGRTLRHYQDAGPVRIGAVGLGVGTLAAYARAGDHITFYEINQDVEEMARKHFSYLRDSEGRSDVVLGDARLSLETQPAQGFHVLALDAFTGDAPPAHLLTKEAFAIYLRHLRPDGVVAFHITNRRVDMMPVVAGLAEHYGYEVVRVATRWDGDRLLFRSDWVLLTRNPAFLAAVPSSPPENAKFRAPVLWTDHYSDLFALLK